MEEERRPRLLTVDEVAERLAVPKSWVYGRTMKGAANPIPHVHVGRYVRFDFAEVVRWIRQQESRRG